MIIRKNTKLWEKKIEKRKLAPPLLIRILAVIIPVVLALVIGAILLFISGVNPLAAYQLFFTIFSSPTRFGEMVSKATTLALAGFGVAIAFRCKVWNIGSEGQICMGAFTVTIAAFAFGGMPSGLLLPLLVVFAFIGGALYAAIAGILRTKFGINEVIITLMLNLIAVLFIGYLVSGPLQDPASTAPMSKEIPSSAWLPILLPKSTLHLGILITLVFMILAYVLLFKTVFGYRIRLIGGSPKAASYAGLNIPKHVMMVMIISGGLAGIAGMSEISGIHHRLKDGFSAGYGFIAILVSLLGRNHPIGIMGAAFLFSFLDTGVKTIHRVTGIPVGLALLIETLVVFFLLAGEILVRRKG